MSAEDRNDLPPLAAGGDRPADDPDAEAFGTGATRRTEPTPAAGPEDTPAAAGEKPAGKKEPSERRVFVGTGLFWGLIVGVVLAILVIVFAAQNTQDSTVKVFGWEWSSPLFVVILISLIVGIVLDEIVGLAYRARRRRRLTEKEELERLRGKG